MKDGKFQSECPKCGNVDILNEKEIKKTVHCQRCYHHYEYRNEPFFNGYQPKNYFNI